MTRIVAVSATGMLGGGELSLLPVLAVLAQRGRVILMSPTPGPLEDAARRRDVEVNAAFYLPSRVRAVSGQYETPRARMLLDAVTHQWRLTRHLCRLKPDLVYCNGVRAQVGATAAARAAGATVAWHVRDFKRPGPIGGLWRGLAPAAGLIVTNSHATADQPGLAHVRGRVQAILNGVDLTHFAARSAEPDGPPRLGMAAHLTPWKGHDRFLRVVAEVRRVRPDVDAEIAGAELYDTAGNADERDRVLRSIRRLGLEHCCRLTPLPPEAMPAWLAGLTTLVHCPDKPEPFGRVIAEAMAVGVPVVLADGGGAREVLGTPGICVDPGDERGLVRGVLELLDDAQLRADLAARGHQRAAERFDERRYASAVAEALMSLVTASS